MTNTSHLAKDRLRLAQMISIGAAEPIGSALFAVHVGLLILAGIGALVLFNVPWFLVIVAVYVTILTLEKATASWATKNHRVDFYHPVLALLFSRAVAFNFLVVSVWWVDHDVFKMAALALLVAATINIFVFHATYPEVIACVVGPIWMGFVSIAFLVFLDHGLSVQAMAAALVTACITPYFYLSLLHARRNWHDLEDTRNALTQSQKQEALGQLVSGVAHDFNNVLAITLGTAERLRDADPAARNTLINQIISAAEQGASLSNQLLAYSRQSTLQQANHTLSDVFYDLQSMLERVMPDNIEMQMAIDPDTPNVFLDRRQLETALINLAINARDAMPSGGSIQFEARAIDFGPRRVLIDGEKMSGRFAHLSVTDTGIGVAQNEIDRVFDPFFTTKAPGEGSGLGLSMVHGFVKQSGGAVEFRSKVNGGTTVDLYLPEATGQTAQTPSPAATVDAPHAFGKRRILLVEDEPVLRDIFAQHVQNAGYAVTLAPNGDAAQDMLASGVRPDLLITDVAMPGHIQGQDLAAEARKEVLGLPVIFVSGHAQNTVLQGGQPDQADMFLQKPVHKEALLTAIRSALQNSDPSSPNPAT